MSDRQAMIEALKAIVIPHLRANGFRGTFPHFRRIDETRIDLLTFQFDKWGGGFVIEISQCPPTGHHTKWGAYIPPQKVTAHDLHPDARLRLQPRQAGSTLIGSVTNRKPVRLLLMKSFLFSKQRKSGGRLERVNEALVQQALAADSPVSSLVQSSPRMERLFH
jgi:hypothetical protein